MKKLALFFIAASFFAGCKSEKSEKSAKTEIKTDNFTIKMSEDAEGQIITNGRSIIMNNTSGDIEVVVSN